jgi:putative glutamine amidotransferase
MTTPSAMTDAVRPRVLVPACHQVVKGLPSYTVGRKYIEAVELAGAQALVLPGLQPEDLPAVLDLVDGVLLTGSPSNVHPLHFGQAVHDPAQPLDERRDAWVLPLVRAAVARATPLLGICRGLQEINVALGGSLTQAVHELPGLADHRAPAGDDEERLYGPSHDVLIEPGGRLAALLDAERIQVNSLHVQGIDRVAPGLRVEARAPDGLPEAVSVPGAAFALAVQWHPEWRAAHNPVSQRLLAAFGQACRAERQRKHA